MFQQAVYQRRKGEEMYEKRCYVRISTHQFRQRQTAEDTTVVACSTAWRDGGEKEKEKERRDGEMRRAEGVAEFIVHHHQKGVRVSERYRERERVVVVVAMIV